MPQRLTETVRAIRLAAGLNDDAKTLAGLVEIIATLFDGMIMRAVRNPEIDPRALTHNVQIILTKLLKT